LYELFESKLIKEVNQNFALLSFVGFYINKNQEMYVVLPKLFERNGTLFTDKAVIDFAMKDYRIVLEKEKEKVTFVQEFIILLFRTLTNYEKENRIKSPNELPIMSRMGHKQLSTLEVVYSIIDFHRKNHRFYVKETNITNKKANKINWNKTTKKIMPIISDKDIHYFQFKYSKSILSQDDIVLTIFYSLLNKLKHKFSFDITLDRNIPIMYISEFIKFEKKIPKLLKKIKNFYVRDDLKKILSMLYAYYRYESDDTKKESVEYMIIFDFNLLFEDMVNEVISDREHLATFKIQKDGKIIDHIFSEKSFLTKQKTLFIGDSKYYKEEYVDRYSIFKQFTYSRNIIQEFENSRNYFDRHNILLREDVSRGYDNIPNFFIFGDINQNEYWEIPKIPIQPMLNQPPIISQQFDNAFFDRDTLHIFHFKVNLLFLMEMYTNRKSVNRQKYKTLFRQTIRNRIADYYNNTYDVFTIENLNLMEFIKENYYSLWGKIFLIQNDTAVLVLEKDKEESQMVKKIISLDSNILMLPTAFT